MPTPVIVDPVDLWWNGGDLYQGPYQYGTSIYSIASGNTGPIIGIPGVVWKTDDNGLTWSSPDVANAYGWGGAFHWESDELVIASNNLSGTRIDLGSFDPALGAAGEYTTRDTAGPSTASNISGIDFCFRLGTGETVIFYRRAVSSKQKIFYIVHDGASWGSEINWTAQDDGANLTGFVMGAFIDASDRIHVLFRFTDSSDSSTDVFYKRVNADLSLSAELTIETGITGNNRADNSGHGALAGSTVHFPVIRNFLNPLEDLRINDADPPTLDTSVTIFTYFATDDSVAFPYMLEFDGSLYCWWLYSENEPLPTFDRQHIMYSTLSGTWSAETDWYNWDTDPPDWTTWNTQMTGLGVARINDAWAVLSSIPYVHPVSGFNYIPEVFFIVGAGGPFVAFGVGTTVSTGTAFGSAF